jgi:hypothetical protein
VVEAGGADPGNGYEYLKTLNIGYFFYFGPYLDDLAKVLDNKLNSAGT